MQEVFEFRIQERFASLIFSSDEGKKLSDTVRKIILPSNDPRLIRIAALQKQISTEQDTFFFAGWYIHRRYTKNELDQAEMFQLRINAIFEPVGVECGTEYIDGTGCPECRAGKQQQGSLRLDLRKTPKKKDIARTFAHEWIVSQRLGELLIDYGLTGFELRRVVHKGHYESDPYYLHETPTGRKILELAEDAGIEHGTWLYYIWINRPENRVLSEQSAQEYAVMKHRQSVRKDRSMPIWYQLVSTSHRVEIAPPTKTGIEPFDDDFENEYRCPRGDLIGLNLMSEVSVKRATYDGSDLATSRQFVGKANSWLISPVLLISPKFWRLLKQQEIKGFTVEVAHLV